MRNTKRKLFTYDYFILLFSLVLIRLPYLINRSSVTLRIICLLPFAISVVINIFRCVSSGKIILEKKIASVYLLYLLLFGISIIKLFVQNKVSDSSILANFLTWLIFVLFTFFLFGSGSGVDIRTYFWDVIFWICFLYFSLNIVLSFLGFGSFVLGTNSTFAALLGKNIPRYSFPTSTGINSFGVTAGLGLVVSALYIKSVEKRKKWGLRLVGIISIVSQIAIIILTDSRGALFACALAIGIALFFHEGQNKWLVGFPVFAPFLSYILLFLAKRNFWGLLNFLARYSTDLVTLNSRTMIWETALDTIRYAPKALFFGYGFQGHLISGVTDSFYFQNGLASLHNLYLQDIFDIGMLGLVIFIVLIIFLLNRLNSYNNHRKDSEDGAPMIFIFCILYLLVIGIQESSVTLGFQENYFVFTLICAYVITLPTMRKIK